VAVVVKQLVTVAGQERGPGVGRRHDAGLVVGCCGALVGHLEEQQIGELLHVVAIAHAVVAQHVAVVPELLDEGVGGGVHGCLLSRSGRCSLSHFCVWIKRDWAWPMQLRTAAGSIKSPE